MTELENHLLSALKSLEIQFKEQLKVSEQGQQELQKMFKHTSLENERLKVQVTSLSTQVEALNNQLSTLVKAFIK